MITMSLTRGIPFLSNTRIEFRAEDGLPLRKLPGFKKQHWVPTAPSHSTSSFIGKLVQSEIESELNDLHRLLRSHFGLKRKQIDVTIDGMGSGIIESSVLRFQTDYSLDENDSQLLKKQTCLDDVDDLNTLANSAFAEAYGGKFSQLSIGLNSPLDIESLIDAIEDLPDFGETLQMDYSLDATRCEIRCLNFASQLVFQEKRIYLENALPVSPQELLGQFIEYQKLLVGVFVDHGCENDSSWST